jgi:hypothetical protein
MNRQLSLYGTKVNSSTGAHKLTLDNFNAAAAARETYPQKWKFYQAFQPATTMDPAFGSGAYTHGNPSRRAYFTATRARKLADGSAMPITPGSGAPWGKKK